MHLQGLGEFFVLVVVKNLDLELSEGDVFGFIGPNGAGKTTLFNCINGIYKPDEGAIRFKYQTIDGLKPDHVARLGIARTFQNIRIFPNLTVLDNVCVAYHPHAGYSMVDAVLRSRRFEQKERELIERAQDFLAVFGLDDLQDEIASSLPYGQQRRLEIARASLRLGEVVHVLERQRHLLGERLCQVACARREPRVIFLEEGDVADIRPEQVSITDIVGRELERPVQEIDWDLEAAEKGGYSHYMLKEIHEQPEAIRAAIAGRIHEDEVRVPELEPLRAILPYIERIELVACGSDETCASCPDACGACPGCGNGSCEAIESCSSCPSDCADYCGDDCCSTSENYGSCPADCPDVCDDGSVDGAGLVMESGDASEPGDCEGFVVLEGPWVEDGSSPELG